MKADGGVFRLGGLVQLDLALLSSAHIEPSAFERAAGCRPSLPAAAESGSARNHTSLSSRRSAEARKHDLRLCEL